MKERKKLPELHVHSKDLYDSDNEPYAVCKKLSEMGAEGFCLTQHGVLSGIEPMRDAAEQYGLKFVPGIETYYGNEEDIKQNKHLLLLSQNYDGYKSIWKAVSDKRVQNGSGLSVMNEEVLKEYFGPGKPGHGNVIATSACINGVLASILRSNEIIEREIAKIERRNAKLNAASERLSTSLNNLKKVDDEITNTTEQRNHLKSVSETKFGKREKYVEKLFKSNDPNYEKELNSLNRDKEVAQKAAKELETVKTRLAALKTQKTVFNAEYRTLSVSAEKEKENLFQIEELKIKLRNPDDLFSEAADEAKKMIKIFGKKNFYIEIQNHGIDTEAVIYPILVKLARELNIPIVATNDVHMVDNSEEEILKRKILNALRFEEWSEPSVGDDQLYFKTDDEMREWLLKIYPEDVVEEALNNITVIFNRCNVEFPKETHYPVFPSPDGKSADIILLEQIQRGVKWRFPDGFPKGQEKKYKNRLKYEYKIIVQMGYADYHLIVKDFLEYGRALSCVPDDRLDEAPFEIDDVKKWTKENGWKGGFSVGPGRGSAAGSLVCYCLGITSLDPLKYDLLFERFLNPERISMPDIDSDISNRCREKVIQYVKHKYGEESVCGIMTTNAQAPRGAIRIAAKYYGQHLYVQKKLDTTGITVTTKGKIPDGVSTYFLPLADRMAKLVPAEPGISFDSECGITTVAGMLQKEFADNADALEIIKWARSIEGCFTAYGAHAAGIVISDGNPVSEYVPLKWNNSLKEMTTQVDMVKVEDKGLIKMDFLGLKTLDIITDALRIIRENTGEIIDPLSIPMDDKKVFDEIFKKARTNSVFQFESEGMKNMLKRFRPDCFEDLIILVSMFRPGPLQYLDGVIEVKNGRKDMEFICPELEPILGKTYGAIVYQEQVMEIFQKLAGYTLGGADQVRRFMSKKKMDKLVHEKEAFIHGDAERKIEGCVKRGISEKAADILFEQMTNFAKYAFNKSHAAAYALNSYYTAWFKLYYPAEFLAAALIWSTYDKIPGLMNEAKSFGVKVLPPDINHSVSKFSVTPDGKSIRFGLSAIKMVSAGADEIISERNRNGSYISFQDFLARTNIKSNAVTNLIYAGAFDAFGDNRSALNETVPLYKDAVKKLREKKKKKSEIETILVLTEQADELIRKQTEAGVEAFTISVKNSTEKLRKSLENTEDTIVLCEKALSEIVVPDIIESQSERMVREKELLGAFVTAHPLDEYQPDSNCLTIEQASEFVGSKMCKILAAISSVEFKVTKNGKKMAILNIDDYTGSMKVLVFDTACQKYENNLKEGKVFVFNGFLKEEIFNDERNITMNLNFLSGAEKKKPKLLIPCKNKKAFLENEEDFRKKYEDHDGFSASLYIKDEDRIEPLQYKVSEILKLKKGVKEY